MQTFDIGILIRNSTQDYLDGIDRGYCDTTCTIMKLSRAYNLRTAVFSYADIRLEDGELTGEAIFWEEGVIYHAPARLPQYLDNIFSVSMIAKTYPPEIACALRKHKLLNADVLNKLLLPGFLHKNGLSQYAIPTLCIKHFSDIAAAALHWPHTILKPVNGSMGRAVTYVDLSGDTLSYRTPYGSGDLTAERWQELCATWPNYREYLAQPCLDFHSAAGRALDFRLLTAHGAGGKWETVAIYPRIGPTQIVSNVSRGGMVGEAKEALTEEYGHAAEALLEELQALARIVPPLLEEEIGAITCVGLDIGIDRPSARPYLIEVNVLPGAKYHYCKLAEKRVQFYKYLLGHSAR